MLLTPKSLLIPCRSLKRPCRSLKRPYGWLTWFSWALWETSLDVQVTNLIHLGLMDDELYPSGPHGWRAWSENSFDKAFQGIDRGSEIWNLANFVLPILFKFRPSQKIWRDPVNCTAQNDSGWIESVAKFGPEVDCWTFWGPKNMRKHVSLINDLFETNYSQPLRQP